MVVHDKSTLKKELLQFVSDIDQVDTAQVTGIEREAAVDSVVDQFIGTGVLELAMGMDVSVDEEQATGVVLEYGQNMDTEDIEYESLRPEYFEDVVRHALEESIRLHRDLSCICFHVQLCYNLIL